MHILTSTIVRCARSWLGTPWRHRGRDPRKGFDCIGFVLATLLLCGWQPKNPQAVGRLDYDRLSTGDELHQVLSGEGDFVPLGNKKDVHRLQAGDVLTFTFPGHAHTQHIGILTGFQEGGQPYFIHCRAGGSAITSKVVEHALADGWLEALDGAYRIEGVIVDG
jgi:cell wall-associated NlpC family hydrolase